MSKITLNRVASLINAPTTLNGIISQIESAFDRVLFRDGTTPNQMSNNLDMNNSRIINLPKATLATEPIRLGDAAATFAVYSNLNVAPPVVFAADIVAKSTVPITCVTYSGSLYICKTDHTTTSSFDASKWTQIVSKGDITTLYAAQNTWTNSNTWAFTDTQNIGTGVFYTPWYFSHAVTTGSTGSRNSLVAQVQSSVSSAGDFLVPLMGLARITSGSGNLFGINGYAWVDAAANSDASASGGEFNTDIRRNIANKTGIQVVDVATSTGAGSNRDAAVWVAAQTGALGYKYGVELSFDGGAAPVKTSGSLFKTGAYSVTKGLDWTATTFTGNIFDVPQLTLSKDGQLTVSRPSASPGRSLVLTGGNASDIGGEIQQTNTTGGSKFLRVATSGNWQIINSSYSKPLVDLTDTGLLTTSGVATSGPITKTANYTLDPTSTIDSSIILNGSASITLTLPNPVTYPGRVIRLKTIAAFTVVSASSNVVPLAGGAAGTAILAGTAGKWADIQSDGTNWIIMAGN